MINTGPLPVLIESSSRRGMLAVNLAVLAIPILSQHVVDVGDEQVLDSTSRHPQESHHTRTAILSRTRGNRQTLHTGGEEDLRKSSGFSADLWPFRVKMGFSSRHLGHASQM